VRPVRIYGEPVLRQKAREVGTVDDTVRELIEDLRETMKAYNGVGLAANQIGVAQRVLVIDVPLDDERRARLALVNPVVRSRKGSESGEEGCLSIPGVWEDVTRAHQVVVEALDEQGRAVKVEADGYLSRALQ